MSKTEQTSIEWLVEQLIPAIALQEKIIYEYLDKAKAMHKKETCQFVSDYLDDADYGMTAEEYYDQIYKNDIP